jgi:cation:H+ antiporter
LLVDIGIFVLALLVLLLSAKFFTNAAEEIGAYFRLPEFVIGVFIVGIGTSLPELVTGILSVNKGSSEILSSNIIGANVSNILLISGLAAVLNRGNILLSSNYLRIDLHFLMGAIMYFCIIAYDGVIEFNEAFIGFVMFVIYSVFLIKSDFSENKDEKKPTEKFPLKSSVIIILSALGIFFGADYTIHSIELMAIKLEVPTTIISLTLLSLGTTLPELAVNVSVIRAGKSEMAIGNVLGSCVFNTLVIPSVCSGIGNIDVPASLIAFSLPVMAACGLFFYLLTMDEKITVWEGLVFLCIYALFLLKLMS